MLQQKTLLGEHNKLLKSDLLANGLLVSKPGQGEYKKEKNDALAKVIFTSEFKPSTCYKIKLESQPEILPLYITRKSIYLSISIYLSHYLSIYFSLYPSVYIPIYFLLTDFIQNDYQFFLVCF